MSDSHIVYLGLGTNLGERQRNLEDAIERLGEFVDVEMRSSIYETEPWGYAEQPRYLNMVISGRTRLAPLELLDRLKGIEEAMGRQAVEAIRYGPRPIDIDILFYDDEVVDDARLQVPHPRIEERAFVLAPLADIAPDMVHPRLGKSVAGLLAEVDSSGVQRFDVTG
jgi:2-amino-4-hydroxy-6-hydroxymethyldihydropteridine diphosphokinase